MIPADADDAVLHLEDEEAIETVSALVEETGFFASASFVETMKQYTILGEAVRRHMPIQDTKAIPPAAVEFVRQEFSRVLDMSMTLDGAEAFLRWYWEIPNIEETIRGMVDYAYPFAPGNMSPAGIH